MKHPDAGELLARLEGELDDKASARVGAHVARCAACRARSDQLGESARDVADLLAAVDGREPARWRSVALAPTPPVRELVAERAAGPARPRGGSAWRWAAGLVLIAGAGAAATLSGVLPTGAGGGRPAAAPPQRPSAEQPPVTRGSAVLVSLANGALDVDVTGTQAARLHVSLHEGDDVIIEVDGDVAPRVLAGRHTVTVDLDDAHATLHIRYPRSARAGVVRRDGRVVARIASGTVTESP